MVKKSAKNANKKNTTAAAKALGQPLLLKQAKTAALKVRRARPSRRTALSLCLRSQDAKKQHKEASTNGKSKVLKKEKKMVPAKKKKPAKIAKAVTMKPLKPWTQDQWRKLRSSSQDVYLVEPVRCFCWH